MKLTISRLCEIALVDPELLTKSKYEQVKKSIQLQIKANGGIGLTIDEVFYTKEEINNFLEYFDSMSLPENEDDINVKLTAVEDLEEYHNPDWHLALKNPENIKELFDVPTDLMVENNRKKAQELVDNFYAENILRSVQVMFSELNFQGIMYLFSYEYVFSPSLVYKLKSSLLTMFNNFYNKEKLKFNSGEKYSGDIQNSYYFDFRFYFIGTLLFDVDKIVTSKFMELAHQFCQINKLDAKLSKEIFEKLTKIPHDPEDLRWIRRMINQFNQQLGEKGIPIDEEVQKQTTFSTANTSESSKTKPGKIIASILVIIIAIAVYQNYKSIKAKEKQKAQIEELHDVLDNQANGELSEDEKQQIKGNDYFAVGMFHYRDNIIADFNNSIEQLEKNIKNPGVLSCVKNTLSMYCYGKLVDSLGGFEFDDASIPQMGYHQASFRSDSDVKSLLFVAFDLKKADHKPRGILYLPNQEERKFYLSKDEMVMVVINPVIKNNKVIYGKLDRPENVNISLEGYKLISNNPKAEICLSYSYKKKYSDLESFVHIYNTMRFYRMNRPYRFK